MLSSRAVEIEDIRRSRRRLGPLARPSCLRLWWIPECLPNAWTMSVMFVCIPGLQKYPSLALSVALDRGSCPRVPLNDRRVEMWPCRSLPFMLRYQSSGAC